MAKNTTEAEVTVTLNGDAARNELKRLQDELKKYNDAAEDAYKHGNKALGDEMTKNAERLGKEFRVSKKELKDFSDFMKGLNSKSLNELKSAATQLKSQIKGLSPDTQQFIDKTKQLQQVNSRIKQLESSFKGLVAEEKQAAFSIKGLADGFNKYFGIATAAVGAITGVSMAFRKCAEDAAMLDDVYSDVMKTTGLTHDEVQALDEELMKLDTRTSREQLLNLARDAGKLGIQGSNDVLAFVRAADQIQVALGEDLGDGAIKNLGKISDVFGYTKKMGIESSMLSIGSAINAVGQSSTASEAYLVDFTQRLAGIGAQTKISAANIIGFASGLDQSAMKVEMAATAFQTFLTKMYEDPAKFAEYANMEVEKFTNLLNNDANTAVMTILQNLKDQDGFAALVPIFKDMGVDGERATTVLAAMASNLDAITDAQSIANVEFEKATSISNEFTTKNNNMQASLDKARKEFKNASITLGQSLNPIMLKTTNATTYLIKALAKYGKEIKAVVITIAALTVAIKASTIAHTVYHAVVKGITAIQSTFTVAIKAASYAFNIMRGHTIAATKAYIAMKAAMSASVFGAIATAASALVVVITRLVKKQREASEEANRIATAERKANDEYAEQASKIRALTTIVENNNISLAERKKALEELKAIVPSYHGALTEEGKLINANKEALDDYCKSLRQQIRLQKHSDELNDLEQKIIKKEDEKKKAEEERQQALVEAGGDTTEAYSTLGGLKFTKYGKKSAKVRVIDRELSKLYEQEKAIGGVIAELTNETVEGLTEEQKAIKEVADKYKELFNEVNEQYRDNPSGGNERIEQLKEEQRQEIAAIHKKYAQNTTEEQDLKSKANDILTESQFDFLQQRYEKLTKKEKAMVDAGYDSLSKEDSAALKKRYDKLMAAEKKLDDKRYQEKMKQLEKEERAEENLALRKFLDGDVTSYQDYNKEITPYQNYEKEKLRIKDEYIKKRLDLAKEEKKDTSTYERQQLDSKLDANKKSYDDELADLKQSQKDKETELKKQLAKDEITQDEYDTKMLELKVNYLKDSLDLVGKYGQDETQTMQAYLDAQVEAEILAIQQMEKLKKEAKDSLRTPDEVRTDGMATELERLEELHDAKLLSEEEYEKAVQAVHDKYKQQQLDDDLGHLKGYFEKANKVIEGVSEFTSALQSAETAKLEAEYQARLTAAGDNADEREAIEAEYEQKKLDIQKKYADVDMAINIAKAIAAGALASVEAIAAAGGNPVLSAVFIALIAATTAAEVASIIQQRNAIKNASAGGGGGSAPKTGSREMTGYAEGGYTEDHTTVTTVGERGREWVAPAWMVRKNPVTFSNLERYRKTGSHGRSGSVSRGFADGGFTENVSEKMQGGMLSVGDLEAAVETAIVKSMQNGAIRAYLVRNDLTELDAQTERFKKQTSR